MSETLICQICGKEFVKHGGYIQKYCSDECRRIGKKRLENAYRMKIYKEGRIKKKKEPLFGSRASVKSRPLDSLSGEQLLNYGKIQIQENMESLALRKEAQP